jgi:hypothetical protein
MVPGRGNEDKGRERLIYFTAEKSQKHKTIVLSDISLILYQGLNCFSYTLRLIARIRPGNYQNAAMSPTFLKVILRKREKIISIACHNTTTPACSFVKNLAVVRTGKTDLSHVDCICACRRQNYGNCFAEVLIDEEFQWLFLFDCGSFDNEKRPLTVAGVMASLALINASISSG